MGKFRTVTYEVHNPKIKNENGVRFAFLADFHGSEFGKNNSILIEKIRKWSPYSGKRNMYISKRGRQIQNIWAGTALGIL